MGHLIISRRSVIGAGFLGLLALVAAIGLVSPAQAQGELSSALSRLLVASENYPNLKSNQSFQDLRAQLEGTENRIAIARNRYIKAVQDYNVTIRQLPQNLTAMVMGYKEKPQFAVENEAAVKQAPKVDFGK